MEVLRISRSLISSLSLSLFSTLSFLLPPLIALSDSQTHLRPPLHSTPQRACFCLRGGVGTAERKHAHISVSELYIQDLPRAKESCPASFIWMASARHNAFKAITHTLNMLCLVLNSQDETHRPRHFPRSVLLTGSHLSNIGSGLLTWFLFDTMSYSTNKCDCFGGEGGMDIYSLNSHTFHFTITQSPLIQKQPTHLFQPRFQQPSISLPLFPICSVPQLEAKSLVPHSPFPYFHTPIPPSSPLPLLPAAYIPPPPPFPPSVTGPPSETGFSQ